MTTISKAFFPEVTVSKSTAAAGTAVAKVQFKVSDATIREQIRGFDGMEHAFAMLPSEKDGVLTWKKVDLDYKGGAIASYYNRTFVDVHAAQVEGVDAKAIAKYGAAFGVETNEGVIWAQGPGDNTKATIR